MGICLVCNMPMPPDFCEDVFPVGKKCLFCARDTNVLLGDNNTVYVKQEVSDDYAKLLRRIADSDNVKDKMKELVVNQAVKDMG